MKRLVIAFVGASLLLSAGVLAQEVGALVDALVEKRVLSPAEAEKIRARLSKDESETPAGKIKLSDSITELRLYGDGRLRYQYDQADAQLSTPATGGTAAALGSAPNVNQRSRWRFRLRLNADFKLGDHFFGGVGLATGQASDSNMEILGNGFDNYNIFINRAFLGWKPTDWLTIIAGKQANPFYTTELVWDPDINPSGLVETFDIGKALFPESPFQLQIIAGQFVFFDNNEFNQDHDASTDGYLFGEQLKSSYKFSKDTTLTFAPGLLIHTAADVSGLRNSRAFTDAIFPNGAGSVQTTTNAQTQSAVQVKYSSTGVPTVTVTPTDIQTTTQTTLPATGTPRTVTTTGSRVQAQVTLNPVGGVVAANSKFGTPKFVTNPALANQTLTTTQIAANGTTTVVTPVGTPVSGETRSLYILTAPGDLSFKLGGLKTKVYWDFAYNLNGGERYGQTYGLNIPKSGNHNTAQDNLAWLVGFQVGDNKKAGDFSLFANYREIGISSIDPNLNDSDFALSALNVRGVKVGAGYNFTDFLTANLTYSHAWNLKQRLIGGQATGGAAIADLNDVDVFIVELNWKF